MQYKIKTGRTNEAVSIEIVGKNISIPLDPDNIDYKNYLEWLAKGNKPITDEVFIESNQ